MLGCGLLLVLVTARASAQVERAGPDSDGQPPSGAPLLEQPGESRQVEVDQAPRAPDQPPTKPSAAPDSVMPAPALPKPVPAEHLRLPSRNTPVTLPGPAQDSATHAAALRNPFAFRLQVSARGLLGMRIGIKETLYPNEERVDYGYGIGGFLSWAPDFSLGLELERAGLGRRTSFEGQNSTSIAYNVSRFWVGARAIPLRHAAVDLFVALRVGLAWQSIAVVGTRDLNPGVEPARTFRCSAGDAPGLALSGGLGADFWLTRRIAFETRFDAAGERLSSDPLSGCAPGIGATSSLMLSLGVAYEFDL